MWVTGQTGSADFPLQTLSGAYNQDTLRGGSDAFILKFDTSGVRQWATYYGGTDDETGYSIHSDGTSVWVTGNTNSTDFPVQTLSGAYNQGSIGGNSDAFILKFTSVITGIKFVSNEIPSSYSLSQNYPNPFNPTTKIKYGIPLSGFVKLVVFDALGREVETLVNENQQAGVYEASFNASQYSSGVYFYKIIAEEFISIKKMLLIK